MIDGFNQGLKRHLDYEHFSKNFPKHVFIPATVFSSIQLQFSKIFRLLFFHFVDTTYYFLFLGWIKF